LAGGSTRRSTMWEHRAAMSEELFMRLGRLERVGWKVKRLARSCALPRAIIERYAWLPREILDLVSAIDVAHSADERAWVLSASDTCGTSASAFAWNEWERLSLAAAGDDDSWKHEITSFWDGNFPLVMSVRSGYAYFAIERSEHAVVVGEEPEL